MHKTVHLSCKNNYNQKFLFCHYCLLKKPPQKYTHTHNLTYCMFPFGKKQPTKNIYIPQTHTTKKHF